MKEGLQHYIVLGVVFACSAIVAVYMSFIMYGRWHDEWSGYNASQYVSDGICTIATLKVDGEITTFSGYGTEDENGFVTSTFNMEDAIAFLNRAEADSNIKGTLVLIDSPGGSPSASKMIADKLKEIEMPVGAFVLDMAASGGYYIATGADTIIANPFSDIGSIGVTMSYLDYSQQNLDSGLEFISLASGKFKDSGSPDKPLTEEERALFERDLSISHDAFVREVAQNRNLPVEEVAKVADGSTLPAPLALEAGLVDSIGSLHDVRAWFADRLDIGVEDVIFCN